MGSVAEIEQAIARLNAKEFLELGRWFDVERNRKWGQQIEQDSASGALDSLLKEVDDDIAQGKTRPIDKILDDPKV